MEPVPTPQGLPPGAAGLGELWGGRKGNAGAGGMGGARRGGVFDGEKRAFFWMVKLK